MFSKLVFPAALFSVLHCSAEQIGHETQVSRRRAIDTELDQATDVAAASPTQLPDSNQSHVPVNSEDPKPSGSPRDVHQPANTVQRPEQDPPTRLTPVMPPTPAIEEDSSMISPTKTPASNPTPTNSHAAQNSVQDSGISPASITPAPKPNSTPSSSPLPDAMLNSDEALTPVPSLSTPAGGLRPARIIATLKLQSDPLPNAGQAFLSCDPGGLFDDGTMRGRLINCYYVDQTGIPVAIHPNKYSWKFEVFKCPGASFEGNMSGQPCDRSNLAACEPIIPSTGLDLGTDINACVSAMAEMRFSLTDKDTGSTVVQVLHLTKTPLP